MLNIHSIACRVGWAPLLLVQALACGGISQQQATGVAPGGAAATSTADGSGNGLAVGAADPDLLARCNDPGSFDGEAYELSVRIKDVSM